MGSPKKADQLTNSRYKAAVYSHDKHKITTIVNLSFFNTVMYNVMIVVVPKCYKKNVNG